MVRGRGSLRLHSDRGRRDRGQAFEPGQEERYGDHRGYQVHRPGAFRAFHRAGDRAAGRGVWHRADPPDGGGSAQCGQPDHGLSAVLCRPSEDPKEPFPCDQL